MEKFFSEFASDKTKNAWMEEVLKDLKGKTYDKIWWKTYEGFELEPYYKGFEIENINIAEDSPGEFPYMRSNKPVEKENSWLVRQEISNSDPKAAKTLIAEAIKGGAEGIDLKLNGGLTSGKPGCKCKCGCSKGYSRGIVINSKNDFTGLFNSIDNEKYSVNIEAGVASKEIFDMVKDSLKDISKGSIDNDPLKELALNGEYAKGEAKRFEEMKTIFDACKKHQNFKGLVISNGHFHDSGSTIVQKIAYLLSTAVFYKEKIASEISFSEFSKNIELSHSIGQYYLLEIAGLRALRLLWSNIAKAYDAENVQPVDIHAKTGLFNKTVFDPYVNMLRTTTEAMSAVTGGCNSLTVLPFNICLDEADSFSNRIARNTQFVLRDEAHFDKFIDPSKGSYYIEKATDLIAKDAWKLFQLLEENGGIYEALKRGDIQKELIELKKKRLSNFSMRRDNLVGTNFVPNYAEKSVCTGKKENLPEQNSDIFSAELYKTSELKIENICPFRLSEEFEKFRKLTEKYNRENEKNVTAFMATIGNLTMRKARASFATGYLAAGGFDIIDNNGFKDADEAVKEAFNSKAEIIVICSSDEEYPQVAPEIASKIKSVRPGVVVILAGYPKEIIEELKKAGIDEFIHLRSDSIETIKSIQTKLGILK